MANLSGSSVEDDNVFTSQFAALLKPIRELTKQGCWELNIAEKLEEYIHYIQDLAIEVNVDGEPVKLDFAKAAMVLQNSVQIYSKKVENLWLLLQEITEFLSSHGNGNESNGEGQTPAQRFKRGSRKRHQIGDVDIFFYNTIPIKFGRKFGSKIKKKSTVKDLKRIQTLPHEMFHLEEIIGSLNSLKIKLYTSHEHLGYSSDLRCNFPIDPNSFFLKIDNGNSNQIQLEDRARDSEMNIDERPDAQAIRMDSDDAIPVIPDAQEDQPPNLDDWQNDRAVSDDEIPMEDNGNSYGITEEHVERMQLRQRDPVPLVANREEAFKDPWSGMEPYADDDIIKKPCGAAIRYRIPEKLRKKKNTKRTEAGKNLKQPNPAEQVEFIDEYLGNGQIATKKPNLYCQPDYDFWEDYVYFIKTIGNAIKKQLKLRPERNVVDVTNEYDHDDLNNNDHQDNDNVDPVIGNLLDRSNDLEEDGCAPDLGGSFLGPESPTKELDESKRFEELVQQFQAEYTASAKAFVTSTELTRKVQAWYEMIQPRLREAEFRQEFDIHLYGSRILEEFGSGAPVGSQCSFAKIVEHQPKNEVARYFLATLQLANAYNVEIALQEAMSLDGVELKLLSRERHHEHMDDFIS